MNKYEIFFNKIRSLPSYQTALLAKERILSRNDLLDQFVEIQNQQKRMVRKFASSNQANYQTETFSYQESLNQMSTHPLVAEYLAALEELQADINFLSNILKAPNLEL